MYKYPVQNSVASGVYDVLLGNHKGNFGFNVFDFNGNISTIKKEEVRVKLIKKYNEKKLSFNDIRSKHLDILPSIDRNGNTVPRSQRRINIHQGYRSYFGNLGCPVVYKEDWKYVKSMFNNKVYNGSQAGKLGKLYLYQ